jgi:hypothetical protein
MPNENTTAFDLIYKRFLGKITSDMYLELTEQDTMRLLQEILIDSIPLFEFPRFDIFDYEEGELVEVIDPESGASSYEWVGGAFNSVLTKEEINIVAEDMVVTWLNQQLKSTENIRQKYSGADFKFTSQANHMAKLMDLVKQEKAEMMHLQRLYKRRVVKDGQIQTTMKNLMSGN